MPTYEYVCTECGAPLEVIQSIHDPALTECPACAGRLRKVFGNVGVVFKGSGFYRTDSRGKAGSAAAAKSGSASAGASDATAPAASPAGSAPGAAAAAVTAGPAPKPAGSTSGAAPAPAV